MLISPVVAGCGEDGSQGGSGGQRPGGSARLGKPTAKQGQHPDQLNQVLEDEQSFEQESSPADPASLSSDNKGGDPSPAATSAYLEAVVRHADRVWTRWFTGNGYREPNVGYQIIQPGATYTTRCRLPNGEDTFSSDFPNAFYCGIDPNRFDNGVVVLPVETMSKMWTGRVFDKQVSNLKRAGDFAAAMITAHEFGHHIEGEMSEQSRAPSPPNPYKELIADCFAGVWAYSVFLDNYLEDGDVDEAVNALEVIGDDLGSHGTGAQRQNAFLVGYAGTTEAPGGGVPGKCIDQYWVSS